MDRVFRCYWRHTWGTEFLGRYIALTGAEACERARREHGIDADDGDVLWTLTMEDQVWTSEGVGS